MTQPDAVSVENSGIPSGRLPKELFGVTLIYEDTTFPDWPTPRPKTRKKRQHFLFTKRSSQTALLERLAKLDVLDKQEVLVLYGRIEWEQVEPASAQEEVV